MNRLILSIAFLLGVAAIVWIGSGFVRNDALALAVTLVIGAVYLLGFAEIIQFRRATVTLDSALAQVPAGLEQLDDWLRTLHPSLRNAVRLRIEGERQPLPGPVFAPYFVGLLVMLGLLGTFIGMVVTLKGAVLALEGTTELQAIRAGLTQPIQGLGLAFGTSVAGVAASAMLGLIATLSRRERLQTTGILDHKIATEFHRFSSAFQRQETYRALQYQAQILPELVQRMQTTNDHLLQSSKTLGETLLANQQSFQQSFQHSVHGAFTELAQSVALSLQQHLADSARQTGEMIQPLLSTTCDQVNRSAAETQQQVQQMAQQQLQQMGERFEHTSRSVTDTWQQGVSRVEQAQQSLLAQLQQSFTTALQQGVSELRDTVETGSRANLQEMHKLLQSSEDLITERRQSEQQWSMEMSARTEKLGTILQTEFMALRDAEQQRSSAAVERLAALESTVADHLARLGNALEAPMARLIETATQAPRAAADIIEQMREKMSANMEHDNAMLTERTRLLEDLARLLNQLDTTASDQRQAVEHLVASASTLFDKLGSEFTHKVADEATRLETAAAQLTGSSMEVASLGDAFGHGVNLFRESNEKLIDSFKRVEAALDQSAVRNDEQLAYYVAQAREIIDLSVMSQKEVFEELRRLSRPAAVAEAEEVC